MVQEEIQECVGCGGTTIPGNDVCMRCAKIRRDTLQRGWAEKEKDRKKSAKRYAERKAAGLCTHCGKIPPVEGKSCCVKCAAQNRRSIIALHTEREAAGLCTNCGKKPPVKNKSCCVECTAQNRRLQTTLYTERKAAGLCIDCGKKPFAKGKSLCVECAARHRRSIAILYTERKAAGLCTHCGTPAEVGFLCLSCWFYKIVNRATGLSKNVPLLRNLFDNQGKRCAYTREKLIPGTNASIDHKTPKIRGGSDEIENLQWVTNQINRMKTDMTDKEFLAACSKVINVRKKQNQSRKKKH